MMKVTRFHLGGRLGQEVQEDVFCSGEQNCDGLKSESEN